MVTLIDLFSYIYHWRLEDILDLSMAEVKSILIAAEKRIKMQNESLETPEKKSNIYWEKGGDQNIPNKVDSTDGDSIMRAFSSINSAVVVDEK